jgi:hypothetical protein
LAVLPIPVLGPEVADRRKKFLGFLFDRCDDGYICISRRVPDGKFEERFFRWPNEEDEVSRFIEQHILKQNVWFCPMLLGAKSRNKYSVEQCPAAWADLDTCPPESLLIPPTLLLETSEGRHQALWVFDELVAPIDAEDISKRIAYYHADEGADKSGWDLTQLLRVPYTLNQKYQPQPTVNLVAAAEVVSLKQLRDAYPEVVDDTQDEFPFPEAVPKGEELLRSMADRLPPRVWMLLNVTPDRDWSKALWALEMLLAETGLSREEILAIVRTAQCNKYKRDNRDERLLWREICKAWIKVHERNILIQDAKLPVFEPPDLLSDEDVRAVQADRTFIENYIEWASGVGDAATAYHQAGAFVCLSSLMSGSIQLPTSFGNMVPNLWFLLLADTTLTRKSTVMDLTVDLLMEVDPDIIMATDGSIEGIFSSLSMRPGRPSIFLRDEFSGLIEMMTKRDYYAGMAEALTKMYDGKFQKRVLRRETIEVKDPILIIFAGGIRTKLLNLITSEQITSGFLPRFVFISALSDISRLQPLGPPSDKTSAGRDSVLMQMKGMKEQYQHEVLVKIKDVELKTRNQIKAQLTPSAWQLYNEMERKLLEVGVNDVQKDLLTPVMDRLAKSGLKASILIAGSRRADRVIVEERDIYKAFYYVTEWRQYAMDVVSSAGLSEQERLIKMIFFAIIRTPGILRSQLMQTYHLTKRNADAVFDTLEERGLINRVRQGRSESLTPTGEDV